MQSPRAHVIEKIVLLEHSMTQILGALLNIDVASSVALGNKNASLPLFQKVQLIKELGITPDAISADIVMLVEIRNKFAHVYEIDSFSEYFKRLPSTEQKSKKAKFLTNFNQDTTSSDEEVILSSCFDLLCLKVGLWLNAELKNATDKLIVQDKKDYVIEEIRSFDHEKHSLEHLLETTKNVVKEIPINETFYNPLPENN